jgi:hypothetical protein
VTEDLGDWFADDADGTQARNLGRSAFVDAVERGLTASHKRRSSTVFSVVGAWGSGKSSVIDAVITDLESAGAAWTVVRFNPWMYQDLASLQTGFFTELAQAFPDELVAAGARQKIADFAEAVSPLASLTALVGVDGSVALKGLSKLLGGDRSVAGAQRRLEQLLDDRALPVLIVMDDLDRLAPDELLLTLKVVRLIGRLPYVHYLLAYDEDTLLDALGRTGLVGKSKSRARDYLEKVIQVRFDVPALRPDDIRRMTSTAMDRTLTDIGTELSEEQVQRFTRAYFDHLEQRLSTPRAIRRYWAQVRVSIAELHDELDVADFLILTWLRTAEPGAYRLLQERRAQVLGTSRTGSELTTQQKEAEQLDLRTALLASGTRPTHLSGVASVLGQIFPAFRGVWEARPRVSVNAAARRVSNPFYFDRFFALGVPEGDIRDSTVRAALDEITIGSPGPAETLLVTTLMTSPELALGKLEPIAETAEPGPLFQWLAEHYFDIPHQPSLFTSRERAVGLATSLLRRVPPADMAEVIQLSLRESSGIPIAIQSLASASRKSSEDLPGTARIKLNDALRDQFGRQFEIAYKSLEIAEPLTMEPELWSTIWAWESVDRSSLKRWIQDRHATWGGLKLLARFVSTSRLIGGPSETRLGDIDFDMLGNLVDLPGLEEELKLEVDQFAAIQMSTMRPIDSPENRLAVALGQLKARRLSRSNNSEPRKSNEN